MGTKWGSGTYVGHDRGSNAYIIASHDKGIVHTHAVQRRPLDERWSKEVIEAITETPWSLREKRDTQVRFHETMEKVELDVR